MVKVKLEMYEKIRKRNNAYHFLIVYYVVVHFIISAEVFTVTPSDRPVCSGWLLFCLKSSPCSLCTPP